MLVEDIEKEIIDSKDISSDLPISLIQNNLSLSALLDAISLFEINGSRWMFKVPFSHWSENLHEHCCDEVVHTKLVQNAARTLRSSFEDSELVKEHKLNQRFFQITENYMACLLKSVYRLTLNVGREDKDFPIASYAILSFLIERRILRIYPLIAKYASLEIIQEMAKTIIGDEKKHIGFVSIELPKGLKITEKSKLELIEVEEKFAVKWKEQLLEAYAQL